MEGNARGRQIIYARYRPGELSVGVGDDIEEAAHTECPIKLYTDHIGDGLDGVMRFDELKIQLHSLFESRWT